MYYNLQVPPPKRQRVNIRITQVSRAQPEPGSPAASSVPFLSLRGTRIPPWRQQDDSEIHLSTPRSAPDSEIAEEAPAPTTSPVSL